MKISETSMALSPWQNKQATLLYHFASLDYLKSVKERIDALVQFSSNAADKATDEERDAELQSERWGDRDTSCNWRNSAGPFLAEFQRGLETDAAERSNEIYSVTGCNYYARAMAEFSMAWMTLEEQAIFDRLFGDAAARAMRIDQTMRKYHGHSEWTDFGMVMASKENSQHPIPIPKFRIRGDISGESGSVPTRTGVYVCVDDPNASLQFAWSGGEEGKLLQCSTFNELGEAALAAVGRAGLWLDEQAMLDFVIANQDSHELRSDSFFDDSQTPALAPSLVARQAFTAKPCKWYYVEQIDGEFEAASLGTPR
jgi:hypothetical protein